MTVHRLNLIAALWLMVSGCTNSSPGVPDAVTADPNVSPETPATETSQSAEAVIADANQSRGGGAAEPLRKLEAEPASESVPVADLNAASALRLRQSDDRPPVDASHLQTFGIHVVRSRRLVLLSDLSEDQTAELPQLADQLFEVLESRLGRLRPAADRSDFQVTGCLMQAPERFEAAGLLPDQDLVIRHGRHLNYRFWMRNPPLDYYRRHLLLHEFTHCFMNCEFGMRDIPPLWYSEGLPEFFATHRLDEGAPLKARFGVLPDAPENFPGWGRISEIRRSFRRRPSVMPEDAGLTNLQTVMYPADPDFQQDSQYAHAWALYWLLQHHPVYADRFAALRPVRSQDEYRQVAATLDQEDWRRLAVDWLLTLDSLTEGFDLDRSFPLRDAADQRPLSEVLPQAAEPRPSSIAVSIRADREWQYAGVTAAAGTQLHIQSQGQFSVAQLPKPWRSEAGGITIDYHRGRPLGELTGILVAPDGSRATRRIPIGLSRTIEVPFEAELWMQVNESASARNDNQGAVSVSVEVKASPAAVGGM